MKNHHRPNLEQAKGYPHLHCKPAKPSYARIAPSATNGIKAHAIRLCGTSSVALYTLLYTDAAWVSFAYSLTLQTPSQGHLAALTTTGAVAHFFELSIQHEEIIKVTYRCLHMRCVSLSQAWILRNRYPTRTIATRQLKRYDIGALTHTTLQIQMWMSCTTSGFTV